MYFVPNKLLHYANTIAYYYMDLNNSTALYSGVDMAHINSL